MSQQWTSRIWISEGLDYTFPEHSLEEVMAKPNIGLCFSGGGTRAMTAAMGQLRALDYLGVMPSIRYISCVSGGSWASTIYTYYRQGAQSDGELLGPVTRAQDITEQHLQTGLQPSQLAYGATKSLVKIVAGWQFTPTFRYSSHDVWNYAIGQAYLEDYGLFDSDIASRKPDNLPYFSYDDETVQDIKHANPDLADVDFLTVRPNRPYLIVNSCVLLPQDDPNQSDLISFEYTPLAVGRPYLTNFMGTPYGGGFIEPFAYRGGIPVSPPTPSPPAPTLKSLGNAGWVEMSKAVRHYSLTETTGTSSSAFAKEIISQADVSRFTPEDFYWAVNGGGPYSGEPTLFGDGGILENNGLIPLIQRGVKLAIVFANSEAKLDPHYLPTADPHAEINDPNGHFDVYIPSLFGYSNPNWDWNYPNNQVFPTSELAMVLSALKHRLVRNEPLIVTCEHTVLANSSWGVKARTEKIWVTWCYLDRCVQWESQLGSETVRQQIIAGNRTEPTGPYANFPNYKTMFQNGLPDLVQLTPAQVTLLADFACDCILLDEQQTIVQAINQVR